MRKPCKNRKINSALRHFLLGYKYFDWHIDSGDAHGTDAGISAQTIAANVLGDTNGRENVVILMHDFKWRVSTLEALPAIIDGLRNQGYAFDTLENYPD